MRLFRAKTVTPYPASRPPAQSTGLIRIAPPTNDLDKLVRLREPFRFRFRENKLEPQIDIETTVFSVLGTYIIPVSLSISVRRPAEAKTDKNSSTPAHNLSMYRMHGIIADFSPRCNSFDGPEVLSVVEEKELPNPAAGEARVLARCANFTDTMIRKGMYPGVKDKPPFAPEYDMVGVVDAVRDSSISTGTGCSKRTAPGKSGSAHSMRDSFGMSLGRLRKNTLREPFREAVSLCMKKRKGRNGKKFPPE